MRPVSPVIPTENGEIIPEVTFAKDQPEYIPLPAHVTADGVVVSRWELGWRERWKVLWGGSVWLSVHTHHRPLQPVMLTAECPVEQDGRG